MKYETFKKLIVEHLKKDIPNPKEISIQPILKNNGLHLDGLVIMEDSCNISPTLYLNYYYDSYKNGVTFQQVYETILNNYQNNKPAQNIDIRFFTEFEHAKSRIAYKLINYKQNKEILQDVPHIRFLDLAIVFYCLISMDKENGNATILIHNSHLDYWNITLTELFSIAKENTPGLLQSKLRNMSDILVGLAEEELSFPPLRAPKDTYPMFVLTNQMNLYGAGCMLYPELLREYAQKAGTDFYILPSSIHEIILIPVIEENCMAELSDMVKEVNSTQLEPDEILSDHAYYYSLSDNTITM